MTYFNFRDTDIISIVYSVFPTRSISLQSEGAGGGSYIYNAFRGEVQVLDSGSLMPGRGDRTFYDIDGNLLSQSFYLKSTIELQFTHTLTASEKVVAKRMIQNYSSGAFYKPQNYTSSSIFSSDVCQIMNIPSALIGSGIKPGSFTIDTWNGVKLEDDGYGGIYTGSVLIGSILYEHGVVYFGSNTDQDTFGGVAVNSLQCNFSATNHIPMNVYICKAPKSLINFSTNPSYTVLSGTRNEITTSYPKVFVTGIGLYDENFELVGVAKLANPILFEEDEGAEFRLKLNF